MSKKPTKDQPALFGLPTYSKDSPEAKGLYRVTKGISIFGNKDLLEKLASELSRTPEKKPSVIVTRTMSGGEPSAIQFAIKHASTGKTMERDKVKKNGQVSRRRYDSWENRR